MRTAGNILIGLILGACVTVWARGGKLPPDIKVWYLEPTEGLVRKQDKEVLTWQQAEGYYCQSPTDFQRLIATCPR